jgi:hypothetical protein
LTRWEIVIRSSESAQRLAFAPNNFAAANRMERTDKPGFHKELHIDPDTGAEIRMEAKS